MDALLPGDTGTALPELPALSLAALGDINLDGYSDVAVGAPYDGVDGRGAVYIFHGSARGVRAKYTQV